MVNGKMALGVEKDRLMVRLDPDRYEEAMEQEGLPAHGFYRPGDEGFVFCGCKGINHHQKTTVPWVDLALEYNKR